MDKSKAHTFFHLGFNDKIYHEGNISKIMPDFEDVFSLLDVCKGNGRSRGKRKNGNVKHKRTNTTVWTLADLCKILKSGLYQMLSKLSSLVLDEEANKFFDRKHAFYQTALLTRCYTQYALGPYIASETNHIRHFIKIPFINSST